MNKHYDIQRAWAKANPYKTWDSQLRYEFGISASDYTTLYKAQHGRCAICKQKETYRRLSVDHDHKMGRIRGLLCNRCNRGIGLLNDSTKILLSAVSYLRKACLTKKK